jgi:ABC-type branched-subunit amino acid transport system substrate-binding protein
MLRGHSRRWRTWCVLGVLVLLASGCGSQLDDEERASVINAMTARRGSATGTEGGSASGGTVVDGSSNGQATGGDAGPSGGGPAGPSGDGPSGGPVLVAGGCGGTGGATATGVTAKKLTVATLADISGVQPGLFQSAHQAARAATAYINSQGGICGRALDPMLLDSKTDAGGNRAAMLDACDKAFAVVGSMSAFDDGSAAPGEACGIPDISAIVTNAPKAAAKNTYAIAPNATGWVATTPAKWLAKRFPSEIKKTAQLWLNQAVTANNARERMKAWEKAGFVFIYTTETQVLEANYTRFVQEMRSRGVQAVSMVSDFQSVVRLQKAMRQQNYIPKVRAWDSVAYDADYLTEREAVEGSYVFINNATFEDRNNPEMKLYTDLLQRVSPGAVPDYFGLYAWSAYRLFQNLTTKIGKDLTRPKLIEALKATKAWGANGLHAPHNVGGKRISVCNLWLQVRNGRFARAHPSSGFDCDGQLVYTR